MSYHTFDETGLGKLFSTIKDKVTNNFLPLTGGHLTGNLTGQYITGTWLQSTADNHIGSKQDRIVVLNSAGWLYSRTPDEIRGDIGAGNTLFVVTFTYDSTVKGWVADKTVADIYSAYFNGPVIGVRNGQIYEVYNLPTKDEVTFVCFSIEQTSAGNVTNYISKSTITLSSSSTKATIDNLEVEVTKSVDHTPYSKMVTIPSSSWDSSTKTATVNAGVPFTISTTIVIAAANPTEENKKNYESAGVFLSSQGTNGAIIFGCSTVPSTDINVNLLALPNATVDSSSGSGGSVA